MLSAHGKTHTGLVRKINEDSLFCDAEHGVFIVADGMGGHSAGEVASQLAIETVQGFLERTHQCDDCTWPYGIDPALSLNANRLSTAIKLANRRIFKASEARDAYSGMGTTTVAVLAENDVACFASVGDSRIYSYFDGRLEQLTRDHSWAAEVLAHDPTLTPEALAKNPMRHVLTHVLGARDQAPVVVTTRTLRDGEMLLLCSDGLHGPVSDEAIARTMGASADLADLTEQLVAQALAAGGADNVTALVLRFTVE
jgi:serine/threonine protein phosphatase PrpC